MADFIFDDDLAAAFEAAVTRNYSGANVFNLSGETASAAELIRDLSSGTGSELKATGKALPIHTELEASELTPYLEIYQELPQEMFYRDP